MLNLGHSHPDFTYENDAKQARLTLLALVPTTLICCLLIVAGVFAM